MREMLKELIQYFISVTVLINIFILIVATLPIWVLPFGINEIYKRLK